MKIFWKEALTGKKITKVFFDKTGLRGFMLEDGTKVEYDYLDRGMYIVKDKLTSKPMVYN